MSKPILRFSDAFALLLLSIASIIGINQYVYGVYNHCITVPFIKSLLNPELYPNDYLIAEIKYFYSLFLPACSFLVSFLKSSLPTTFFTLYSLSIYASLIAFFLIGLKLFERKDVAYFATMLLIFSITTIGRERTIENSLMERTFALPFLLFSLNAFFSRYFNTAALLAGLAFLFHPLSAAYMIAMQMACMIFLAIKEKKLWHLLTATGILAVVISPLLIMKFQNPAPGLSLIHASTEWIELLQVRSSHHLFPSMWSKLEYLQGLSLLAAFFITWKYKPRQDYHRIILISFVTMIVMFVAGTIFTEVFPVSIIIQFQLFRSFKFLVYFAIIYYANFIIRKPNTTSGITLKLLVSILMLMPYVHENKSLVAGIILLMTSGIFGLWLSEYRSKWKEALIPAQIAMLLAMGIVGSLNKVHFTISNASDKNWLAAQRWAKQNTPTDAAFIVPPYLEGFRVESERTLYGEWKDGTQMFFDPLFGNEWIRRMKMVGYQEGQPLKESYNQLPESDLEKVAMEMKQGHSKVYAVMSVEREELALPEVYSNDKFSVYEVPLVEVVEFNLVEDGSHELVAQSSEVGD